MEAGEPKSGDRGQSISPRESVAPLEHVGRWLLTQESKEKGDRWTCVFNLERHLHFNTIEDYQAADFKEIVAKEASGILDVENLQEANRFVVLSFGDLKNYLYHYR